MQVSNCGFNGGNGRFSKLVNDQVVDLIVTAQMGGHMSVRMARDIWVGVDACSG